MWRRSDKSTSEIEDLSYGKQLTCLALWKQTEMWQDDSLHNVKIFLLVHKYHCWEYQILTEGQMDRDKSWVHIDLNIRDLALPKKKKKRHCQEAGPFQESLIIWQGTEWKDRVVCWSYICKLIVWDPSPAIFSTPCEGDDKMVQKDVCIRLVFPLASVIIAASSSYSFHHLLSPTLSPRWHIS